MKNFVIVSCLFFLSFILANILFPALLKWFIFLLTDHGKLLWNRILKWIPTLCEHKLAICTHEVLIVTEHLPGVIASENGRQLQHWELLRKGGEKCCIRFALLWCLLETKRSSLKGSGIPSTKGGGGLNPPPLKFWRPSKIMPNSTQLWKLLKNCRI